MNNEYSMMEMFANPDLFGQLSLGEKLAGAGVTTLMGMGITFIVLLILWACIAIMSRALKAADKKEAPAPAAAAPAAAAPAAPAAAAPAADNGELIAVITAAIAALEGSAAASNLIVRKINRISGETPSWANAGHMDCIDSRRR